MKKFMLPIVSLMVLASCSKPGKSPSTALQGGGDASSTPASSAPLEATPVEGTPGSSTPAQAAPASSAPVEGTLASNVPVDGIPGSSTLAQATPEDGAQGTGAISDILYYQVFMNKSKEDSSKPILYTPQVISDTVKGRKNVGFLLDAGKVKYNGLSYGNDSKDFQNFTIAFSSSVKKVTFPIESSKVCETAFSSNLRFDNYHVSIQPFELPTELLTTATSCKFIVTLSDNSVTQVNVLLNYTFSDWLDHSETQNSAKTTAQALSSYLDLIVSGKLSTNNPNNNVIDKNLINAATFQDASPIGSLTALTEVSLHKKLPPQKSDGFNIPELIFSDYRVLNSLLLNGITITPNLFRGLKYLKKLSIISAVLYKPNSTQYFKDLSSLDYLGLDGIYFEEEKADTVSLV